VSSVPIAWKTGLLLSGFAKLPAPLAASRADEIRRLWAWVDRRVKGASGKNADFIANRATQGKKYVKAA
jgi:hypothetical protein